MAITPSSRGKSDGKTALVSKAQGLTIVKRDIIAQLGDHVGARDAVTLIAV